MLIIGTVDIVDLPEFDLINIPAKIDTGADTSAIHCTRIVEKIDDNGDKFITFWVLDDVPHKIKDYTVKTIKNSFGQREKRKPRRKRTETQARGSKVTRNLRQSPGTPEGISQCYNKDMANAGRDDNRTTTLLGLSSVDGVTPTTIYVNPTTHGVLTDTTLSGTGLTNAEAVDAADTGLMVLGSDGSNYRALATDASGNLQIDVLTAPTTAVTGTFWQTTQPVSLVSVPSHAVTNAGTFAVQPGSALTGPANPTIDSYTHLAINLNAGANQVLVASAASKQIWVYGITYTCSVAGTVSFQDEDDTAVTGIMDHAANSGLAMPPSGNFSMPIWKLATDKDLEVDVVDAAIDGWLDYAIVSV